jgi:hypothetical protein
MMMEQGWVGEGIAPDAQDVTIIGMVTRDVSP